MTERSLDDIYSGNDRIGMKFRETVGNLTADEAAIAPEVGKWTVAQVVEHVAMVDNGISRICAKLLHQAKDEGKLNSGGVNVSVHFLKNLSEIALRKLEAPERVQPVHGKTVAESLAKIEESRQSFEELRPLFEEFDSDFYKFPHPYFGDLSAAEWLLLSGGHKARHLDQIRRILEGAGQ